MIKKTGFIWVVLAVLSLHFLATISSVLSRLIDPVAYISKVGGTMPLFIMGVIINLITLIVIGIFVYKLYKITSDVVKWAKIAFGVSVATSVIELIFIFINPVDITNTIPTAAVGGVVTVISIALWLMFISHLKKVTTPQVI